MKVLLSIKPEYVERIFAGTKRYEFRRVIFKSRSVKTVVVYTTSPVQKVIGEFDIDTILSDTPERIWRRTSSFSGISKKALMAYFGDKTTVYAIKVKEPRRYPVPLDLQEAFDTFPPQSFVYIQS